MKLLWKGKMTETNLFSYSDLPQDAKPLHSKNDNWKMYFLTIPLLAFAYGGIRLKLHFSDGAIFTQNALYLGIGCALIFLSVHELIHVAFCPRDALIYIYWTFSGLAVIPATPLKKSRYLVIALMPTFLLGIIPYLLWICNPFITPSVGSILFSFSIGSMGMCIGDIYNAILSIYKMPKNSVLVTSGTNCYYFDTSEL